MKVRAILADFSKGIENDYLFSHRSSEKKILKVKSA